VRCREKEDQVHKKKTKYSRNLMMVCKFLTKTKIQSEAPIRTLTISFIYSFVFQSNMFFHIHFFTNKRATQANNKYPTHIPNNTIILSKTEVSSKANCSKACSPDCSIQQTNITSLIFIIFEFKRVYHYKDNLR
jgi:hypothetical protein